MPSKPRLSIRIDLPGGHRLGPGKAALLQAIADNSSLSAAAQDMGMSYPKALKLVDRLNASFPVPLILMRHGGATGGGTELTEAGRSVLRHYNEICEAAASATVRILKDFRDFNFS